MISLYLYYESMHRLRRVKYDHDRLYFSYIFVREYGIRLVDE